jgi:hypothetical protein
MLFPVIPQVSAEHPREHQDHEYEQKRFAEDHGASTLAPRPRSTRPGRAPVVRPSRITATPLTSTCVNPVANWCGFS